MAGKGRAGVPNKPKLALEAMLRRRIGPDYDAVCELADLSEELRGNDERLGERIKCLESVARYTRPQLKQVEHTGEITTRQLIDLDSPLVANASKEISKALGLH